MEPIDNRTSAGGAAASAKVGKEENSVMVFRPPKSDSPVLTLVALALWLGPIQFNLFLALASVFFFEKRTAALVLGIQLFFMFVNLSDTNRWGRKIGRFIWKHAVGYFPITLHVEDYTAFDPRRAYVFGYEPHSVVPLGMWALSDRAGLMPMPKMKILASSAAFYVPFQRQIWTWLGVVPITRENFCSYLRAGYSCTLVPGGLREMLYMDHDNESEVAFIKSRKGFVRIALQTGTPLVPVFCFGQDHAYNWWRPGHKLFIKIAEAMKAPPVLHWGKFGTPIPFRSPIHVFVGRPIEVKQNDQPTVDEINEVHDQFVIALQELHDNHKNKAGYARLHLRLI
ncbi:diacylglycerol O-acyltransferase 2D-like isoform X2 [Hordeum vulgare subsp. vulgare]|uniref:Acyltransferase n=1 Tax=Hordeum vulgare subsp. vulgare TaxID=112509 RepID=A0A8I6WYQ0_HORVV|nr:diacylglycerol O-acyltransferase 2D-like isoform X2 [Hordeum vulgare subsp. vulgare]